MRKKNIFTLLFLYCLFSNCNNDKSKEEQGSSKRNIVSIDYKKLKDFIFSDSINVFANLSVNFISLDSIFAITTFVNKDKSKITLYKPVLPTDSLFVNSFAVLDNEGHSLKFTAPLQDYKFFFGNQFDFPFIIPKLKREYFIFLNAGDSIRFNMNLASKYDFKSFSNQGKRVAEIGYAGVFPLINADTLVTAIDKYDGLLKPVFFPSKTPSAKENFGRVLIKW